MNNWKFMILIGLGVIGAYLFMDFFKPVVNDNTQVKKTIDSLNSRLVEMQAHQLRLDSIITNFNQQIDIVDSSIRKIKGQKTIIREIYHEKINSVNSYDNRQIDSFLSDRYPRIY